MITLVVLRSITTYLPVVMNHLCRIEAIILARITMPK